MSLATLVMRSIGARTPARDDPADAEARDEEDAERAEGVVPQVGERVRVHAALELALVERGGREREVQVALQEHLLHVRAGDRLVPDRVREPEVQAGDEEPARRKRSVE